MKTAQLAFAFKHTETCRRATADPLKPKNRKSMSMTLTGQSIVWCEVAPPWPGFILLEVSTGSRAVNGTEADKIIGQQ